MCANLIPEAGRHDLVNALVAKYSKFAIFKCEVKQYAITGFCLRHAKYVEDLHRAFRHRLHGMAFEVNLDFTGCLPFSVNDFLPNLLSFRKIGRASCRAGERL